MKTFKQIFILAGICAIALISCKKDCKDDCLRYNRDIKLTGASEVPANNSRAKGTAEVVYNKCDQSFSFSITYKNLTSDAVMAHIHGPARIGVNAGIKVHLTELLPGGTSGSFRHSVPVDGETLNLDSLNAGLYYFNIHTKNYPGGEIRGQIVFK